ncbi:Plasmodium exported protein, unknown function [Plasmodium malariae]|uniref:Fam-h protein n=1 Tax=Plasmodium malariae TaxID=5858 RepID=A0A1D3JIT8_PLAMA|nr:Plasmodium exported protein, unknown function [Plasmodium malariae]XP_028860986.1 Plasmodium exported protein, unknown function [Plasmodium malariae]SBT86404.1 Plasmodium exported protein, unknown function [Plasmodium malariae]SCN11990.1 Plasmodium exported protein, unknown function [Plasmodium malariae]
MKTKNKLLFSNIIFMFMWLSWVRYISSDKFNVSLDENYNLLKKLARRTCRLLSKYKPIKDSITVLLKENISNNEKYKEKYVLNDVELTRGSYIHPSKSSSNNIECYENSRKSKSLVCQRKDPHFGKRILDKIYYSNNVKCAMNSDFNFLKNCKKNKIYFLYALFFLFVVRLILDIASIDFKNWNINLKFLQEWEIPAQILSYILTLIFLLIFILVCRKIKKYDKMLHVKSEINNSQYNHFHRIGL